MTNEFEAAGWQDVPDAELAEFHQTADVFLNAANALQGQEPADRVAAAFLYAGARFTAFALQAQLEDGAKVDATTRDWVLARFDEELLDHAAQHLRANALAMPAIGQVPDAALDVLTALNDMDEMSRRLFLRLADRFIHPANDMIGEVAVSRIAAAMVHASARFNAYVMQARGLPAGPLDATIAADFQSVFGSLLDFHLGHSVVTEREP